MYICIYIYRYRYTCYGMYNRPCVIRGAAPAGLGEGLLGVAARPPDGPIYIYIYIYIYI